MKHGQTSTEYLVISAVVIIIAVLVIAVLGGMPSFSRGATESSVRATWRVNPGIAVNDYAIFQTGYGQLVIQNNNPNTVVIENITLGSAFLENSITIRAGRAETILVAYVNDTPLAAGENYEFPLSILYLDTGSGSLYETTASDTNIVGSVSYTIVE